MIAISEPVAALTQGLRHLPQGNVASGDAAGQGAELCRHREYEQHDQDRAACLSFDAA
jgi:hypothetical protein